MGLKVSTCMGEVIAWRDGKSSQGVTGANSVLELYTLADLVLLL